MTNTMLRRLQGLPDIFGTDLYVHYSAAYVWQANQIAHSFIGLFLVLLGTGLSGKPGVSLAVLAVLYAVKELLDFAMAARLSNPAFPANRAQVATDGLVDWSFVTLGGALGAVSQASSPGTANAAVVLMAIALLGFFLWVRRPYLRQKRAFDRSGLPYFSRLATIPVEVLPADPDIPRSILAFLRRAPQTCHQLIVTGAPRSGRTSLASAIGGEATVAAQRVRYLSGARLLNKSLTPCEPQAAPEQPWSLPEADVLIVDELAPLLRDAADRPQVEAMIARLFGATAADEPGCPLLRPNCDQPDRSGHSLTARRIVWVIDIPELAWHFHTTLTHRFPGLRLRVIALGTEGDSTQTRTKQGHP